MEGSNRSHIQGSRRSGSNGDEKGQHKSKSKLQSPKEDLSAIEHKDDSKTPNEFKAQMENTDTMNLVNANSDEISPSRKKLSSDRSPEESPSY